jgi:hypothetical protein
VAVGLTAPAESTLLRRSGTQCPPGGVRRSPAGVLPGPANRRSPSEQASCARLVVPSKCRPGDRPRPGNTSCPSDRAPCARLVATKAPVWWITASRQDVRLPAIRRACPPGSDQQIPRRRITAGRRTIKLPAIKHACPPESDQQIRADGSPPAGERSSSRRSGTHARPRETSRTGYPSGRARGARLAVARRKEECHRPGCPGAAGRRWRRRGAESRA